MANFTKFWQIYKKKLANLKKTKSRKLEKNGSVGPVKQGFLFSSPYGGASVRTKTKKYTGVQSGPLFTVTSNVIYKL